MEKGHPEAEGRQSFRLEERKKKMLKNVGVVDRAVRFVIGIVLLALALLHVVTGTLAIVAYIVGAIALITGLVRFCPAWSIFGVNTSSAAHK